MLNVDFTGNQNPYGLIQNGGKKRRKSMRKKSRKNLKHKTKRNRKMNFLN
jgi:hypothetical protein